MLKTALSIGLPALGCWYVGKTRDVVRTLE